MLAGIMATWFTLTALSVLFVAIDSLRTPESPVLKWAFVLFTAYTGPIGAFLYVLGCREPLPGLHEQYTASHWRQTLGSTMHCVAGDGLGILVGAVIGGLIVLSPLFKIGLEYLLGFGFGWVIFQALFMRASAGGTFGRALRSTFIPELVSMNYLMAGMMVVMAIGERLLPVSRDPAHPEFWFVISMALLIGFVAAWPVNSWLVRQGLKHGMMTLRPPGSGTDSRGAHRNPVGGHAHASGRGKPPVGPGRIAWMVILSFLVFGVGMGVAMSLGH